MKNRDKEKQFAYVDNTACDKLNFILDFTVGAGNNHNSVMFDELYVWEDYIELAEDYRHTRLRGLQK